MDITPRKRASVLALKTHASLSIRQIATKLNISRATVGRIVKRGIETGDCSVLRHGKCGRKRKTTSYDDKLIVRNSVKDPRKTSKDLQRDLAAAGVHVDSSTVRRRLLEVGRTARRPLKKQLLTDAMKRKRLRWARKHKGWTKYDFRNVVYSDETHFEVHGHRSFVVRRSKGEPLRQMHIQQAPKYPPKKMFWGTLTARGPGRLIPVDGMMNSDKYKAILTNHLVPVLEREYPDGKAIFQQDLAPCHTSVKMQKFFKDNKLNIMEWPGNSPDLNPIENLWAIIKRRITNQDCSTMQKLISAVIQTWYHDPKIADIASKLIDSMPNRVQKLLKAKGGHIQY